MDRSALRRPSWRALLLAAVVVAAVVHAADAHVWVIWRLAVLSWDSPTSQFSDEIALQGVVYSDGARRAREETLAAFRPVGVVGRRLATRVVVTAPRSSDPTRSPPLA